MKEQKLLGEFATLAQWAGIGIGALLFFHVVGGKKWKEAHTAAGFLATGLFVASQL